ncbi:MAG TPA: type VI secretion system-associated protein TagF [Burkholderiaceae bacterium]|nr:type VI secretion system-associated protein TagF [Burkholderiaceae bacterium]
MSTTAGFFGKAIAYGDFVARRLPRSFVDPWDAWLRCGLLASRATLGESWFDAFLTCPIWRYTLGSGICGDATWAGVLMPSVDRVGRYYPLTVAAAGASTAAMRRWIDCGDDWYAGAETLARLALREDFDADALDAALDRLPSPGCAALAGWSLWWTCGGENGEPRMLVSRGLPEAGRFAWLIAGDDACP